MKNYIKNKSTKKFTKEADFNKRKISKEDI